jgi:hypothetical protein
MQPNFATLWALRSSSSADTSTTTPAVRTQTAVVLSLADAIEHVETTGASAVDLRWQLLEELSRLSSCIRDAEGAAAR